MGLLTKIVGAKNKNEKWYCELCNNDLSKEDSLIYDTSLYKNEQATNYYMCARCGHSVREIVEIKNDELTFGGNSSRRHK